MYSKNSLLKREGFAFISIHVDGLILWLEVTLHLSWILPEAYCSLPDWNFLYSSKIDNCEQEIWNLGNGREFDTTNACA